jgi:hypothetical protein
MKPKKPVDSVDPKVFLREMYQQHGRIRRQILARKLTEMRWQTYKKGYEIRIVVKEEQARDIVKAMKAVGIKNGKPYEKTTYKDGEPCGKATHKVIPIYGKLRTEAFLKEIVKVRRKRATGS